MMMMYAGVLVKKGNLNINPARNVATEVMIE
jgi:hypothetical protein